MTPPRPRRPRLTEADRAEWAAFAQSIAALPGRPAPAPDPAPMPSTQPRDPPSRVLAPMRQTPTLAVGAHPGGVDKSTWQKLRTGKLAPTRRLDLHGHTAQRAHTALLAFLRAAHAEHLRCVEVITGRGTGDAGGVLRRELPLWLNQPELRPLVLAATHPHPANPGSVRILLRRVRGG